MSRRGENIYKRKDGRWEGRYPKGRKTNGRIHYGYVYASTYQETKEKVIHCRSEYQQIRETKGEYAGTVNQWVSYWLESEVVECVKLSTYASYCYKFRRYILPDIGDIKLVDLNKNMVQEMIQTWQKAGLAHSTIRVLIQLLKMSMTWAQKKNFLLSNPCDDLHLPKKKPSKIKALSIKEQKKLEIVAKKDSRGFPVLLALHTGLRIGEIAALSWNDIDFDEQIIQVKHTYQRIPIAKDGKKTSLIYTDVKSQSSVRTIPFSKQVKKWLYQLQKTKKGMFVFGKGDTPLEPRTLTNYFQLILKKAQIGHFHFHQLRHTFATRCIEAKSNIAAISALLGHASAKMTLDIYVDGAMEERRNVIEAVDNLL